MVLQLLQTDPNWPRQRQPLQGITRRFILGMALLSCAMVLLGLPLVGAVLAFVTPPPLEYRNVPFTVCSPESPLGVCDPLKQDDTFRPGDVVPFMVDRCVSDMFSRSAVLAYVVSRNVVNDANGTRTILPSLATDAPSDGCQVSVTYGHQLPESLPPGRYYIEGVATAYGRFRTANAYFKTQVFSVVPR